MKKHVFLCFLILCLALPALARAEVVYSETIPDLPMMATMKENAEKSVKFESAEGRIVESFATVESTPEQIEAFYKETLPALGWKHDMGLVFSRKGEQLAITLEQGMGVWHVRFLVTPQHKLP